MSQVRQEDAAKIAFGVQAMRSAPDLDVLSERLVAFCADLVPANHASYAELDPFFGRTKDRSTDPCFTADLMKIWDAWQATMMTQPIILHYQANPTDIPRRMSDIVDDADLRRTPFWAEVMGPLGADRQLVLNLGRDPGSGPVSAPLLLGVNINRDGKDFTDAEHAALTLLCRLVRPIYRAKRAETHKRRLVAEPYGRDVERLLMSFGLSPRQAEVAYWMMQDKTNPEIADILGLRSQTVRQHTMAI